MSSMVSIISTQVQTKELKNCTKEMVIEYHNKTIYDCKNVTKRHCTTLWTVNIAGEKVISDKYMNPFKFVKFSRFGQEMKMTAKM